MFSRYAVRSQIIRSDKKQEARPLINPDDFAEIATVAGYWGKKALIGFSVVYTFVKVVDTSSKIAILKAEASFSNSGK